MKLNHIHNILKENQQNLIPERKKVGESYHDMFQINNVQPTLTSLRNIEKLSIFKSISNFKSIYPIFWSWTEGNYSDRGAATSNIINGLYLIRNEVESVFNILEEFIPKDEGYIISVKLPEYESLSDLPIFYKNLDIMFTPLINYFGDDTLTIHSFENGSKWNDFLVKNKETIKVIMLLLTSGAAIYASTTEIQKNKLEFERTYQSMQEPCTNQALPADLAKVFEKQIEDKYDEFTNEFIQILEEEEITIDNRGSADGEIRTVIRRSLKSYQVLIDDGTQFYGQLDNDDEDINKLVEKLDSSQKAIINLREFQLLSEGKVKSLMASTHEETGASINDED